MAMCNFLMSKGMLRLECDLWEQKLLELPSWFPGFTKARGDLSRH